MSSAAAAAMAGDPIALLYPELKAELKVTRALLAVVPWDKADWKPHPKSMSLRSLATHVAELPSFATMMATTDKLDFTPDAFKPAVVNSTDELLALFDGEAAKLRDALAAMDWSALNGSWKMVMGEHTLIDNTKGFLLRHMGINHLVHHRAQLGVYLRLLDVKLPGSYGPSADT